MRTQNLSLIQTETKFGWNILYKVEIPTSWMTKTSIRSEKGLSHSAVKNEGECFMNLSVDANSAYHTYVTALGVVTMYQNNQKVKDSISLDYYFFVMSLNN